MFSPVCLFPNRGQPQQKNTKTHVCSTHFSPLSLGVNPSRTSASTASHLTASYILLETHQQHVTTLLYTLLHSLLSGTLTFASWMLKPFLDPSVQHFLGLPLLLTPLTSDSYTHLPFFQHVQTTLVHPDQFSDSHLHFVLIS